MKNKSFASSLLACAALVLGAPLVAQSHDHHGAPAKAKAPAGQLVKITEKDAAWADAARKAYPLKTCLTSDEELGSMGKSPEYIYRVEGKADRLVIFCCDGCDGDFLQDPEKYLAKLDAAKAKPDAAKKDGGHHGHHN